MDENEMRNALRMTISDPELVQKIREGGIQSLSTDDLNSFGIEVKDGHMSVGDASTADLDGIRGIKLKSYNDRESGPSPLKRGIAGYIVFLLVAYILLCAIGIISSKRVQSSLSYKDIFFLSLFFVIGLAICLSEFRTASAAKKSMTERVQGKCISHEFGSRTRRSIFEYTYGGKVYRRGENIFANRGYAKIGEVRELMIDPENPQFIYDPKAGNARKIGGIMIGMIFIVIAAVVVVLEYMNS